MKRRSAFTLVELLVVIGIIALLISILLPSLTKARGAANSVDCQARLRQIGQGMQLYASQNQGLLPWGQLYHDAAHLKSTPNPYPNELWWKWHYVVSQMLGTDEMKSNNDYWPRNSPVFIDKDTIEGQPWGWRTDYTANARIMPQNDTTDPYSNKTSKDLTQRKISGIRNAAEVMAVWDSPQWSDYGNSSFEFSEFPGGWQFYWGTYFTLETREPWAYGYYDQALPPGADTSAAGEVLQKKWNKDFGGAPWAPVDAAESWGSAFRFRHLNNTTLNALYADGHCESKKVGEIKYKDICVNKY